MASDEIVLASHDSSLRYLGTLLASQGVYRSEPYVPKKPSRLSYFMGMIATTARNKDLQQILEAERLSDRLQAGIALLEQEADRLQSAFMKSGPGKERSLFSLN
jgi:hypothetical protein